MAAPEIGAARDISSWAPSRGCRVSQRWWRWWRYTLWHSGEDSSRGNAPPPSGASRVNDFLPLSAFAPSGKRLNQIDGRSRGVYTAGNWSPPDSPQGPGGVIFAGMPAEPDIKRAVSFIDGQNLYRHAKDAFGHHHPNYDPFKLADTVCADRGWANQGVRFNTGIPSVDRAPMWHGYWTRRPGR